MCLLTVGELAIIISLFANLDGTVESLLSYQISQEEAAKEDNKKNKDRRLYVFLDYLVHFCCLFLPSLHIYYQTNVLLFNALLQACSLDC